MILLSATSVGSWLFMELMRLVLTGLSCHSFFPSCAICNAREGNTALARWSGGNELTDRAHLSKDNFYLQYGSDVCCARNQLSPPTITQAKCSRPAHGLAYEYANIN